MCKADNCEFFLELLQNKSEKKKKKNFSVAEVTPNLLLTGIHLKTMKLTNFKLLSVPYLSFNLLPLNSTQEYASITITE